MHIGCSGGLMEHSLLLLNVAPVISAIEDVELRFRLAGEGVIASHEDTADQRTPPDTGDASGFT